MDRYARVLRPRTRLVVGAAALTVVTAVTAACSSSTGGTGGGGLPTTIKIDVVSETTGAAGPAGQASQNGQQVAVAEINDTKFLGNSKLQLNFHDTGSQPAQGAALVNQSISSGSQVVLGSILSTVVATEAPVAERAKVPLIYLSSSGDFAKGTTYVWAATPPADGYFHWEAKYLADRNAKNIAVIYNNDVVSTANWAKQIWPPLASQNGLNIVDTEASPTTATDASGVVTKVLAKNPQAVIVLASGTANNAIVLALRRANYSGIVGGSIGMSGAINPLGSQANGLIWPTNFSNLVKSAAVTKFDNLYQRKFQQLPNNYAAAAYDEVWFLARALKQAGTLQSAAINTALQDIGRKGFAGALGDVTYKDNLSQAPGLLIQWNDNKENPIKDYGT
ncbi:MAG TPA: ABC transporter substrate-binding protein [Pseudonocardiaceae bacterium]|jgi:branched-chain amino acid transport system substrate-binding protein|nr:ABC transporter substrate-binding protein [Pseudonocardiaceae bacterium]